MNEDPGAAGQDHVGRIDARAGVSGDSETKRNEKFERSAKTAVKMGKFFEHERSRNSQGTEQKRSRRKYAVSVAVVLVLLVSVGIAVAVWPGSGGESSGGADIGALSPHPSPPSPVQDSTPSSALKTAPSGTTALAAPPNSGPTWYKLTQYESVSGRNGFYFKDPVRIGSQSYPASIAGEYPSSTSDPSNTAVWALGGRCTEFRAWVGKDVDSSNSGTGSGGFYVQGDGGRELISAVVGPADPARLIDTDITGVSRLTLYDTRKSVDMYNAWGSPEVLCTSPPGQRR